MSDQTNGLIAARVIRDICRDASVRSARIFGSLPKGLCGFQSEFEYFGLPECPLKVDVLLFKDEDAWGSDPLEQLYQCAHQRATERHEVARKTPPSVTYVDFGGATNIDMLPAIMRDTVPCIFLDGRWTTTDVLTDIHLYERETDQHPALHNVIVSCVLHAPPHLRFTIECMLRQVARKLWRSTAPELLLASVLKCKSFAHPDDSSRPLFSGDVPPEVIHTIERTMVTKPWVALKSRNTRMALSRAIVYGLCHDL